MSALRSLILASSRIVGPVPVPGTVPHPKVRSPLLTLEEKRGGKGKEKKEERGMKEDKGEGKGRCMNGKTDE